MNAVLYVTAKSGPDGCLLFTGEKMFGLDYDAPLGASAQLLLVGDPEKARSFPRRKMSLLTDTVDKVDLPIGVMSFGGF
jgi:hypothetical protein